MVVVLNRVANAANKAFITRRLATLLPTRWASFLVLHCQCAYSNFICSYQTTRWTMQGLKHSTLSFSWHIGSVYRATYRVKSTYINSVKDMRECTNTTDNTIELITYKGMFERNCNAIVFIIDPLSYIALRPRQVREDRHDMPRSSRNNARGHVNNNMRTYKGPLYVTDHVYTTLLPYMSGTH